MNQQLSLKGIGYQYRIEITTILGEWLCEIKKYEDGKKRGKVVCDFVKPSLHEIEIVLQKYGLIKGEVVA